MTLKSNTWIRVDEDLPNNTVFLIHPDNWGKLRSGEPGTVIRYIPRYPQRLGVITGIGDPDMEMDIGL